MLSKPRLKKGSEPVSLFEAHVVASISFTTVRLILADNDWARRPDTQIYVNTSNMETSPEVVVSSFAFKTGAPDANLILDVRFLPDPRPLMEEIGDSALDGTHNAVEDFIRTRSCFDQFFEALKSQIVTVVDDLRSRGCNRVEFAFGCTGGQHRSVFVAERLAEWLREHLGHGKIHVMHRELSPRSSTDFSADLMLSAHINVCHSPTSSTGSGFNSPSSSSSISSSAPTFRCSYHPDSGKIHVEEEAVLRNTLTSDDVGAMLGSGLDRVRALREKRRKLSCPS